MKSNKALVAIFMIFFLSPTIFAQEFYTYLRQSSSYLFNNKGTANYSSNNNYKFYTGNGEAETFMVKDGVVVMAIKALYSYTAADAREKVAKQIIYYRLIGFSEEGKKDGMTMLRKGGNLLSVCYMHNSDGTYSTLVTAY